MWCQFAQCGENRLSLPNLAEQAFYKIYNNVFLTSPSNCIYLSWIFSLFYFHPSSLTIYRYQEPITRSFHLSYLPSESNLSRNYLFLEAPPTGFFTGVSIIANHKKAVVLYRLRHMLAARKYFNNGEKRGKFNSFLGCYANVSVCFHGKWKNPPPPTYLSSKSKKIRDRVDSRVQLVWRLWVMGPRPLPIYIGSRWD